MLRETLIAVTKELLDEMKPGATVWDINNGLCYEWAEEVVRRLPGVEYWETLFGYADTTHAFIRVNGLFYDAECLEGCEDHMSLPIFQSLNRRQAVWLLDYSDGADPTEKKRDMTDEMVKAYNEENGIVL